MRKVCPMQVMRSLYFALIHITLEYGIGCYKCYKRTYKTAIGPLVTLQKHYTHCMKIILNKN